MSDKGVLHQRKQSQITDYSTIFFFQIFDLNNFLDFNTVYSRLLHNYCQSDESVPNIYSLVTLEILIADVDGLTSEKFQKFSFQQFSHNRFPRFSRDHVIWPYDNVIMTI